MPVYSRAQLRRLLGTNHIRDTYYSSITMSYGVTSFSINVIDWTQADLSLSGQNRYVGAWLKVPTSSVELRVASFNTGSGAYVCQGIHLDPAGVAIKTDGGLAYERHEALSPTDKDRALDQAIKTLRVRREVAIESVADLAGYPLPDGVEQVLGGYAFASPTATLDRVRTELRSVDTVVTATGVEVRIDPVLTASRQLVLDAITSLSLGAGDLATVNIPDEGLVLYKAAAVCWELMVLKAPRTTADEYRRNRDEAARQYNQIARNFKVPIDRPIRFDQPLHDTRWPRVV